jgi:hypothetical protein
VLWNEEGRVRWPGNALVTGGRTALPRRWMRMAGGDLRLAGAAVAGASWRWAVPDAARIGRRWTSGSCSSRDPPRDEEMLSGLSETETATRILLS